MSVYLDVASGGPSIPDEGAFTRWVSAVAAELGAGISVAIRVVDRVEAAELNHRYRGLNKPTNVLSFPFDKLPGIEERHDGDLAICAPVVDDEARSQGKAPDAHWAHMTVHGVLHLLGYDHERDDDAREMETTERSVMSALGYPDPYRMTDQS